MKRALSVLMTFGLLVLGVVVANATSSSFTVKPWAYACGQTAFGNPVTQQDLPGEAACPSSDTLGNASAAYADGVLALSKTGPTSDDLAAGATIEGLTSLSAASYDVAGGSCSGGSPRLNIVTADGKTHFFGCGPNNDPHHVTVDFSAAADGSGNGGISSEDTVTGIDFVLDVTGAATLSNLSFVGTPTPTPTPTATPTPTPTATPTATATPSPSATVHPTATPIATPAVLLAQTGGGDSTPIVFGFVLLVGIALVGLGVFRLARMRRL
jgi:hypothetical protein